MKSASDLTLPARVRVDAGLLESAWAPAWTSWLRAGVCRRAGAEVTRIALPAVVAVLGEVVDRDSSVLLPLGTLAVRFTGTAHGLDDGTLTATLVLRALTLSLNEQSASSSAERRRVWASFGIATDQVSGTVITWGLRPPGDDPWSRMMRDRADLDLVTHLTALELRSAPALGDGPVFGTENPQVLQAAAEARAATPVACFAGQPSLAGALLLDRLGPTLRYHGDFDWPGIAIATRIFTAGATPWRFGVRDYLDGVARVSVGLPLTGTSQPTPWEEELSKAMARHLVAVHEEAVLDLLLTDITG